MGQGWGYVHKSHGFQYERSLSPAVVSFWRNCWQNLFSRSLSFFAEQDRIIIQYKTLLSCPYSDFLLFV